MATLRAIRRRIASITNIQQVTNAMRMVAAARFRRAQENILAARPYAGKMDIILRHLAARMEEHSHPLLETREVKRLCIVVVTGDRGLCGSFNSNAIRKTVTHIEKHPDTEVSLICVGRKGRDFFQRRDYNIIDEYVQIFRELNFFHAVNIVTHVSTIFQREEVDRVDVIYNNFRSAILQEVVIEQLLPIVPLEPEGDELFLDYLYEPSPQEILEAMLQKHLNTQMWEVLLDSNAAEQAARMTAMENATDNAKELIDELILERNRARQTMITKEISEIVGGAEALKSRI